MTKFEEGMNILEERFGRGKDNVIALATISLENSQDGYPMPCVRDVDAYYEDGAFYVVTYGTSNKIRQIEANPEVSVSVNFEDFLAAAEGKIWAGYWTLKMQNSDRSSELSSRTGMILPTMKQMRTAAF